MTRHSSSIIQAPSLAFLMRESSTLSRSNLWVEVPESHIMSTLSTHKTKHDEVLARNRRSSIKNLLRWARTTGRYKVVTKGNNRRLTFTIQNGKREIYLGAV